LAVSSEPVLVATKLRPPQSRRPLVERTALLGRLDAAAARLVLIAAPAGWGKSTVAASWCARRADREAVAWVSLDREDDEPTRFWAHVVGALAAAAPGLSSRPAALLHAPGTTVVRHVLPALVNELEELAVPVNLVLDDLHLVREGEVHEALGFLIAHAPAHLRIVIATRADPPLPLARMRASGELAEIRAADLAFSDAEAGRMLAESLELRLGPDDVRVLRARTEGWAAGLCLAGLRARSVPDASAFVTDLAGDDRTIVEYLSAEVVDQQEPALRDFLLKTSVLDRLCAPLCDAVTGDGGAAGALAALERTNAFLLALDGRREWYRYHHLFRDLLRHELELRAPGTAPALHTRAAEWFTAAGLPFEAVGHALAAERPEGAVELVARHWYGAVMSGRDALVTRWLDALPAGAVPGDARLAFARALNLLYGGRLREAEEWGARADELPAAGPFADGLGPGGAGTLVRAIARWQTGDLGGAAAASRRLVDLVPRDSSWLPVVTGVLAMARHWRGAPIAPTLAELRAAAELAREGRFTTGEVWSLSHEALVLAEAGRTEEAGDVAAEAREASARHGLDEYWVASAAHIAQAIVLNAAGRAEAGAAAAARGLELSRRGSGRLEEAVALLAAADARAQLGEGDAAREALLDAERALAACPDAGNLPARLSAALTRLRRRTEGPLDDLSAREREVLRLLAGSLSQREIAASLHMSPNTLKTHTRRIFRKLGVSTRAEAVRRAREADLLRAPVSPGVNPRTG